MIVTDLEADPDFGWVAHVLVLARQVFVTAVRDNEDFMPVFFMRRGGLTSCHGIVIEGEPNDEMKNYVADFIQARVNEVDPDAVAHIADVRMWPDERRQGKEREALFVAAETRATNANIIQEYSRAPGGEIMFGELHFVKPGWDPEDALKGIRFQGFIARRQRKARQ